MNTEQRNLIDDADLIAFAATITGRFPTVIYDRMTRRCIAEFGADIEEIRQRFYADSGLQRFLRMRRQFSGIVSRLRAEHINGSHRP